MVVRVKYVCAEEGCDGEVEFREYKMWSVEKQAFETNDTMGSYCMSCGADDKGAESVVIEEVTDANA